MVLRRRSNATSCGSLQVSCNVLLGLTVCFLIITVASCFQQIRTISFDLVRTTSVKQKRIPTIDRSTRQQMTITSDDAVETGEKSSSSSDSRKVRILGSQELLMLPRQYGVTPDIKFPSLNHACCTLLSATPDPELLIQAIQNAINIHPLLAAHIEGTGEPEERIDALKMVRKGEPDPLRFVVDDNQPPTFTAKDILTVIETKDEESITKSWQSSFEKYLDDGSWCNIHTGPLWKLELHKIKDGNADSPCALIYTFNHAISDQSSNNKLTDQLLRTIVELENKKQELTTTTGKYKKQRMDMPVAVEDSVLGMNQRWNDIQTKGISFDTIKYAIGKALEGLKNPVILPDTATTSKSDDNPLFEILDTISKTNKGKMVDNDKKNERKSVVQYRTLSKESTNALLSKCRENGVSITNALVAAMTYTISDYVGMNIKNDKKKQKRNYKILQSLDLRRFGAKIDKGMTFACMAGSHDLMFGPIKDQSGFEIRSSSSNQQEMMSQFWKLAKDGKEQTFQFIEKSIGPIEAVRVFDFGMSISDMTNLVYVTSKSEDTKGRAYSGGVTNAGIYEKLPSFADNINEKPDLCKVQNGRYRVQGVYYAAPHTQSGCLYPMSSLTVDGELFFTFNPVEPIVSKETSIQFADAYIELLETVAGVREPSNDAVGFIGQEQEHENILSKLPNNSLSILTALIGSVAVASHAGAWSDFFQSIIQMKNNINDPADFWAALNFWIFFAVGHPILAPILKISDILHESPGPKVFDLVPATFLAANAIIIGAVTFSKEIRNAVNIAALAAFFTYVGAGLDGTAGLGDYNLALDDGYKSQIVKGCPAYDDVRQPSMDGFDLNKYQGIWYEHKFHDWTQFKEVYDTTLDIRLTDDGLGWIDDFAVKGPAPDAAPSSWVFSPVANGAHYFLFGRVDPKDPPGILREKGFGVEFPNYIVDVKKDPQTGEYKEAIQFQCLERGGVRVFEGINFMSRNPEMTDSELVAMHERAEKAGMYPYGASPDQMHRVARRPIDAPEIDNSWQAFWRAIGLDTLLEKLTEAIEDGGR